MKPTLATQATMKNNGKNFTIIESNNCPLYLYVDHANVALMQEHERQLEGSIRFHQNFAAEALRAYNKSQAQQAQQVSADGLASDVWALPGQRSRERAVQTAYCDLWQRNNTRTSPQQEVADLFCGDTRGAQNAGESRAQHAALDCLELQCSHAEAGSAIDTSALQQRKDSAPCTSDEGQRVEETNAGVLLSASSAPGQGSGGTTAMRPTQLLHLVRAALSAKALADIALARPRSKGNAGLSIADFLPRFFAYRFGSGDAVRQMAAFRAGLDAYAGTSSELQSFMRILASRDATSEHGLVAGSAQLLAALELVDGSDDGVSYHQVLCAASHQTPAGAVAGPVEGSSHSLAWHVPPLSPVSDTSALLHETSGQLCHELSATPGAEAVLKAVTRPAFMCSAVASINLGLHIRCLSTK